MPHSSTSPSCPLALATHISPTPSMFNYPHAPIYIYRTFSVHHHRHNHHQTPSRSFTPKLSTLEAFLQQKLFTTPESFYTKNTLTPTILLQQKQTPFAPNKNKNMLRQKPITPHVFILETTQETYSKPSPPETFLLHKHLHTRSRSLLHQKHFTPNSFFTRKGFHRKFLHQRTFAPPVFTPEALCTTILWHQRNVAPHRFYTCRCIFHHTPFTPKALYTTRHLHQNFCCTAQSTIGIRTYNAFWSAKHHTTTHIQGPGMQNTKRMHCQPNCAMQNAIHCSSATIWS